MSSQIRIITSMATQHLLADLVAQYRERTGESIELSFGGGVDVVKRIKAGEQFDVVVLSAKVIDELIEAGLLARRVDLVRSGAAVAVKAGAPHVDISSEEAVKQAVANAASVSLSSGPSGVYLTKLFERWGIAEQIADRMVPAPPGIPVGSLIASGKVALGFQQLSELIHLEGIEVLGPLPPAIQIITVFSAGVASAPAEQAGAVEAFVHFINSPEAAEAKRVNGMEPA